MNPLSEAKVRTERVVKCLRSRCREICKNEGSDGADCDFPRLIELLIILKIISLRNLVRIIEKKMIGRESLTTGLC